jgi:hypothetical protein
LLDQVTGTVDTQASLKVQDPKPDAYLKDLMKMISELSVKVDSIKHLPTAAVTQSLQSSLKKPTYDSEPVR